MIDFLASIIETFYNWTGNFGVAVILFTVLIKLILLPLDIKGKMSTAKMQALTPELQKINEKYANDPEKKNKKTMELYSKNHVSPMSGCLPILITLPIILLMFWALRDIASRFMYQYMADLLIAGDAGMSDFLTEITTMIHDSTLIKTEFKDILPQLINSGGELTKNFSNLPEIISPEKWEVLSSAIKNIRFDEAQEAAVNAGYSFLWIKNIWAPDSFLKTILGTTTTGKDGFLGIFNATVFPGFVNGWFILPVMATAGQYLTTWLTTRQAKKNTPVNNKKKKSDEKDPADSMKIMNKIFPLITLYFCATYNSAFAIYYTITSLVSIIQTLVTDYVKKVKDKKNANQEVINI